MTFLAPAAFLGLLLLAVPVIVHLLRPRKMKQTPFSSLRWLKVTRQRLSRRLQWHQWLLFLMRAGLVVLLVLALAKPVASLWTGRRPADRFIIVDATRPMGHETAEGTTGFDRAKGVAAKLAERGGSGDRTAIVLAGQPPKLITSLTADAGAHIADLKAQGIQLSDAAVTSVLPLVPTMLGTTPDRDVELIFVTANVRTGWQQGDIQAFTHGRAEKLHIQVIDVGPGESANAWIAGTRLIDRGAGEDLILRVDLGIAGGVSQVRSVRLTGIDGLGDDVREVTLQPARGGRVDFAIPASISLAGQAAEVRLEPADSLPSDDRWFLNFDMPWSLRLLLIESPSDAPELPGPGLYLRTALDALAAPPGNHSFRLTSRSSKSVTLADMEAADIILLAGVPRLADEALSSLEKRVQGGAGLVVFLGPQIDVPFYREHLHKPLQPGEGLLPFAVKAFKQGRPDELRQVRWTHPVLAPLSDPQLGDLRQAQFQKFAVLDGAGHPGDIILARFEDDTPALAERPVGAGRVLLWNTTVDDNWTDLPRRRAFVPLVDQMLAYLSAGGVRRQLLVGEPINLPLPAGPAGEVKDVIGPEGGTVPYRILSTGTQRILHLDGMASAGVYRVELQGDSAKAWPFTVNASRDASPLTPMDAKTLEEWWSPAEFELIGGDAALARLDATSTGWVLWPALVMLAGIVLLAETIYVYRLCPRSNPAVVESVVPHRGIMKPMSDTTP
jgi:hypothetical protein